MPAIEIAAALARLAQGNAPLLLKAPDRSERSRRDDERGARDERFDATSARPRTQRSLRARRSCTRTRRACIIAACEAAPARDTPARRASDRDDAQASSIPTADRNRRPLRTLARTARSIRAGTTRIERTRSPPARTQAQRAEPGFETFRIEVGHDHGVKPGNIVGAIANEAGLDAKHIGRIDIREDHSFVDLPEGMPSDVFKILKKVWVSGQQLRITRGSEDARRLATKCSCRSSSRGRRHPAGSRGPSARNRPVRVHALAPASAPIRRQQSRILDHRIGHRDNAARRRLRARRGSVSPKSRAA